MKREWLLALLLPLLVVSFNAGCRVEADDDDDDLQMEVDTRGERGRLEVDTD